MDIDVSCHGLSPGMALSYQRFIMRLPLEVSRRDGRNKKPEFALHEERRYGLRLSTGSPAVYRFEGREEFESNPQYLSEEVTLRLRGGREDLPYLRVTERESDLVLYVVDVDKYED